MNNTSFNHFKDLSPAKTISRIRKILEELGIQIYEKNWYSPIENCYSVRISLMEFPNVGVNGKGISPQLALASAFGELMERLQSEALLYMDYGLMNEKYQLEKTRDMIEAKKLIKEKPIILKSLLNTTFDDFIDIFKEEKLLCKDYFDIFSNRIESLPINLIRSACGSNGMCAGNSEAEALVQGLSELMERFSMKEILHKQLKAPTIPIDAVESEINRSFIQNLKGRGFQVIIKDCSLGGVIPAVAVIVIHEETLKYKINFGSHPIFELAIQRCLTETFQGSDLDEFQNWKVKPINFSISEDTGYEKARIEVFKQFRNSSGEFSFDFFVDSGEPPTFDSAFFRGSADNTVLLKFSLDIIKKMGYPVFIRNVSFLGFPSFNIYIPGMSEIFKLETEELKLISKNDELKETILNIARSEPKKVRQTFELLEEFLKSPFFIVDKDLMIGLISNVFFKDGSDFTELTGKYYLLMVHLSFHLGNFEKALFYMNLLIQESEMLIENSRDLVGSALMFKLKTQGLSDLVIEKTLGNILGEDFSGELIDDLSDPQKSFQYYTMPACGNCLSCPANADCLYEKWKRIVSKMATKSSQLPEPGYDLIQDLLSDFKNIKN